MDGDGVMIDWEISLFGWPIQLQAERLDEGIHVLLTGGCKRHIGAVSVAEPGKPPETLTFPGHKDQYISEPWAKALSEKIGERVCVVCGIHYDNATGAQIAEIVEKTNEMLQKLLQTDL